jgi:23S rRNA pseudouridine1911/1915/1917 synthase
MSSGSRHFEWIVSPEEAGTRLDRFLAGRTELGTRSQVQRLIDGGHVLVQGRSGKAGARLRAGNGVTVDEPAPPPLDVGPEPIEIEVLYEDDSILVVNKPPGLVVHPAPGHWSGTLVNALVHRWGEVGEGFDPLRPGIVHRLDKDTSGVLIIARNLAALEAIGRQFRQREVGKRYLALTCGRMRRLRGVIEGRIARDRVHRKRMSVQARGREAVTRFEVVELFAHNSLLRIYPETGRTHQIRVHLAAIGHPIVADAQYGRGSREPQIPIDRQALHAESISFRHPVTGEPLVVSAPLPDDFAAALSWLREFTLTSG